jgi:hypothetical protein
MEEAVNRTGQEEVVIEVVVEVGAACAFPGPFTSNKLRKGSIILNSILSPVTRKLRKLQRAEVLRVGTEGCCRCDIDVMQEVLGPLVELGGC